MELVKLIYNELFKAYGKEQQILQDSDLFHLTLQNGNSDICEYLLFTLHKDNLIKIKYLNKHISQTKTERIFTKNVKNWVIKIFDGIKVVEDIKQIDKIFVWLQKHSELNSLSGITSLLQKIPYDNYAKSMLIKETKCIANACKENRTDILQKLLEYLGDYIKPLFESDAFSRSIDGGNNECVDMILKHIRNKSDKDRLINIDALKKAINMNSLKIIDLIFKHHSSIELLLGRAFIHCIDKSKIEIAKLLLDKSKDREKVLNYQCDGNNTVLMKAAKHKKEDCLLFIISQLTKRDGDQDENIENKKEEDEKYEKEINVDDIHPMFLQRNDNYENLFHVMFNTEASMKNVEIIEKVLPKSTINELLEQRDIMDELPLNKAFLTNSKDLLDWILKYAEKPIDKFNIIVKRNRFHKSLLNKATSNKSKMIQETKPWLAKILHECLNEMYLNNLEMEMIKDVFQNTIDWKYPSLQSFILESIPKSQCAQLLNRDNVYYDNNPIIHKVIESDDVHICELVLSKISDEQQLMHHGMGHMGYNVVQFGIQKGVGHEPMKLILDSIKDRNVIEFLSEINGRSHNSNNARWANNAFEFAYSQRDKKYISLLSSYIKSDKELDILLHAALPKDKEFDLVPPLLDRIKEKKELKYKLSHSIDSNGRSLLKKVRI